MKTASLLQLIPYILHFCTLVILKPKCAQNSTTELKPHSPQWTRRTEESVGSKEGKRREKIIYTRRKGMIVKLKGNLSYPSLLVTISGTSAIRQTQQHQEDTESIW